MDKEGEVQVGYNITLSDGKSSPSVQPQQKSQQPYMCLEFQGADWMALRRVTWSVVLSFPDVGHDDEESGVQVNDADATAMIAMIADAEQVPSRATDYTDTGRTMENEQ